MTSYALTHSTLFAAGIAGAPVTDWRDYDSCYTEFTDGQVQRMRDAWLYYRASA